jgi:peptidoglycan/LPS O-acetylase OafA/YrhL
MTLVWIGLAAVIIIGLILWEQVALLYVLATLSVTGLLMVVAFADLGGGRQSLAAPNDDSAALGDGLGAAQNVSARTAKRT